MLYEGCFILKSNRSSQVVAISFYNAADSEDIKPPSMEGLDGLVAVSSILFLP